MVTLYQNRSSSDPTAAPSPDGQGYTSYREPDTRVPPKPLPHLDSISVNGVAIPEEDILQEAQHHPADNPGEALRAAAEALVVRELLRQEAANLGVSGDREMDSQGRLESGEDAAIRLLIDREIDVPVPKESECRRYYENNRTRFSSREIYEVRHILLAVPPNDTEARLKAFARAKELIENLVRQPNDFGKLAVEFSACPSAKQGGNLGQITYGDTVPEFETELRNMKEGELSPKPVETPYGFHIIALDRRIEGEPLPFEHVREPISAWLQAASWSRAVSQYVGILAGRSEIQGIELAASTGPLVQ